MGTTTSALEPSLKSGTSPAWIDRVEKPADWGSVMIYFIIRFGTRKDAKTAAKLKSRIYGI